MSEDGTKLDTRQVHLVNGQEVRATLIDGIHYVALADFGRCIEESVDKIVGLAREQEQHVKAMEEMLRVVNEVLEERYPEIRQEVMQAAASRLRMA